MSRKSVFRTVIRLFRSMGMLMDSSISTSDTVIVDRLANGKKHDISGVGSCTVKTVTGGILSQPVEA